MCLRLKNMKNELIFNTSTLKLPEEKLFVTSSSVNIPLKFAIASEALLKVTKIVEGFFFMLALRIKTTQNNTKNVSDQIKISHNK